MELYIQVINNQPVNHPIIKENLLQFFPDINLENNTDYVKFQRVQPPAPGPYTKSMVNHYEFVDNIVRDVWVEEKMTAEEMIEQQNQVKAQWEQTGFASWVFNEETCEFEPPIPYPNDISNIYEWNENNGNWEVVLLEDSE